ncbi:uncharacterized protein [Clytia hemisphaerica]|uniref:uncharacterized protein isoform X2 n=1 Tax=Clytia hemisphaerica TaxID=252671 RepID=UPI0034D6ED01
MNLKTICKEFTGLEKCAACPKENGSLYYCLDANFGLVLKGSASKSKKHTIRSSDLFVPDAEIDSYMLKYDDALKTKDCSNFQAGNNLRSKRKTKKLSVTGIFGMSCRHEFPKLFLNMRHGERLGYAVYLLDHLLEENNNKNLLVHIIYDIACVLKLHLKKKNTLMKYRDFKFGIPVFHSYGHRGDCQVKNSIRRLETFGLMDGELMERLWSYLRSFSKITKEMTPAHRTDLLSDALLHFGSKKMSGIVEVTDDMLDSWKTEEDNAVNMRGVSSTQTSTTDIADWRRTYYEKLKSFYKESSLVLISEKVSDVALHQRKAKRMASALNSFEMRNKVSKRWTVASEEYRKQHEKYLKEKSKETLSTLYSRCSERLMLLVLKKRYADGSAIATRLSKQINKVCSEIKNLLSSYNSVNLEISSRFIVVTYTEVLNVKSTIYNGITYLALMYNVLLSPAQLSKR